MTLILATTQYGSAQTLTSAFSKSQARNAGAFSYTTNFTSTTAQYLAYVNVNFSAAPSSNETLNVYITSRNGSNFDMLLASVSIVASTTTSVSIVVASSIPVNRTDQVKVTCTNNSTNGTIYANIVVDPVQRSGIGLFIYRDGALIASSSDLGSSRYRTIEDEGSPLTQRSTVNFTGDNFVCADSGGKTVCTHTDPAATGYSTIEDEGTPLTQRSTVTFVGDGVECTDTGSETECSISAGVGGGGNTFETIDTSSGTDPVADSATDTLVLSGTAPITVTGNSGADSVTVALTQNAGTDVTADLEEETHASEHNPGGGDELAFYGIIQDEGSGLTARRTVNFTGAGVSCADNGGSSKTDCTIGGTGGWTYVTLGSTFTTSSGTPVSVTGLAFTPAASTNYDIRGQFLLRTTNTAQGARPGVSYPSGMTDGVSYLQCTSSTSNMIQSNGDIAAAHQCLTTGLPDTTGSWAGNLVATLLSGGSPSGDYQITLHSETAGTDVSMRAGSWIAYRAY